MAWQGYFEYDGNEFINATRTEQYAKNLGLHWFRPVFKNDVLPFMLGDGLRYSTPLQDEAPWVDEDIPASLDFYGVYPLDVTGIEDSTRTSTVVESLLDGGVPGRIRNTTKSLVFNTLLVARTEAGAEYGMSWLRQVLLGAACGADPASACNGANLCFLSSPPEIDVPDDLSQRGLRAQDVAAAVYDVDPEECLTPYLRTLRKVLFNAGPTISGKRETTDGGAVWTVTFTAVAGSPYTLSAEVPVVEGFLDPAIESPWVGGEPEGATYDLNGYIHPDGDCIDPVFQPIYDPLCPAVIPPPPPPSISLGCYEPPKNWHRRQFTIPKQYVPLWGEVVPKVEVHARTDDVRNLRLRFYADPYDVGDISDDPCAYCGDIVVSYIPASHTLVLDGSEQVVYVMAPGGQRQRADSLVFKTDGTPFEWPALSCGFGYVVTLDLPQTQEPPVVDLSLYARAV